MDHKSFRVAFFGNHDVGISALKGVCEVTTEVLVIAHPPDPEDGVRYTSLFDFASASGLSVLRGKGKDQHVLDAVSAFEPDLIFVADYRYLLPKELLDVVARAAVNLHPSLLPKYRGRAPLNWAILKGETEVGLTAHFIDTEMDRGDILEQVAISVSPQQDVGNVMAALIPIYQKMARKVVCAIVQDTVTSRPQDHKRATTFPARKPEDGIVDWTDNVEAIHNLIRAVARPYPGAFSWMQGLGPIHLWKATKTDQNSAGVKAGEILEASANSLRIATGDCALLVSDWTLFENGEQNPTITVGSVFEDAKATLTWYKHS